jgi:NAD(P)-dependent dehydrogenase (short-subunit alcohol dehydrogenase family)
MNFSLESLPSQKGRIAIVTGANDGIGFETTLGLLTKSMKAKEILKSQIPTAEIEVMELDLSSLASVRAFAAAYQKAYHQLDLLINNAGIMIPPFNKTEDGFESQMGVNYFSHFLLTNLLFDLLERTSGSRVVSLSSIAHKQGRINFDNLNSENYYNKMASYSQSKLACLLFAYQLQKQIDKSGCLVKSVAAHPGVSNTQLFKHQRKVMSFIFTSISSIFMHGVAEAAQPSLYAALGEDIKGGDFVGPTGFFEMKGTVGKVRSSPISYDKKVAQELWTVSEKLTAEVFNV